MRLTDEEWIEVNDMINKLKVCESLNVWTYGKVIKILYKLKIINMHLFHTHTQGYGCKIRFIEKGLKLFKEKENKS